MTTEREQAAAVIDFGFHLLFGTLLSSAAIKQRDSQSDAALLNRPVLVKLTTGSTRKRTVGIDLGQLHGWILGELALRHPIAESMASLIDHCEAARPHPDWAKLRALPYADLSPLLEWVQKPFREEPPEVPLKGLWFGLFNPCPDGRTPVADIYVCGSERFDPDPQDNSWAVGPDWWPDSRYANSAVLADIYRIAYRQGRAIASNADRIIR